MFVPIPNFPNYEFNNETLEVKSLRQIVKRRNCSILLKEKILKGCVMPNGYKLYGLTKNGKQYLLSRSRICWLTNTGSLPAQGDVVDHIDEDRANDCFSNLQVLSSGDNIHKSYLKRKEF